MKRLILSLVILLLISACTPTDKEIKEAVNQTLDALNNNISDISITSTSTQISTHTTTITHTFTITPTLLPTATSKPRGYQSYHIEYEIETSSPRVWVPTPRYWDGKGLLSIKYTEISPEPMDWIREESGSEIIYWENKTGITQVYRLVFDVELTFIDITDAADLIFTDYDESTYVYQKYTISEKNIQSESEEIISLANEIKGDETNPYEQARLIHSWMVENIDYEPGERDALSVLNNMGSDCAGKAHLYIALLRSIGIPSRTVAGIHSPGSSSLNSGVWYPDKTMGYHVWTEFYLPGYGWAQVDPAKNFETILENRIITSKGTDIQVGHGFPLSTVSWLHLPYNSYQQIEDEPIRFIATINP